MRTIVVVALVGLLVSGLALPTKAELTPLEKLGEFLYFDRTLSEPDGQSCADCHLPEVFFVDPDNDLPVSQGVLPQNRFGNRNSPMAAYAMFSPDFHFDPVEGLFVGGQFWDGRAADLVEQALQPFLNPLEMNNPNKRRVVLDVLGAPYADLFISEFGHDADYVRLNIDEAYHFVAEAIAVFEQTDMFAPFSSKYDYFLMGYDVLNEQELRGLELFEGKAQCNLCHPSEPGLNGEPPLFTDFTYDNLGVPGNPDNPFYDLPPAFNPDGEDFVDLGLGGVLGIPEEMGKHKVMTLRNIGETGPYMHNGVFATLKEVVDFYNARDLGGFPPPEVAANVNTDELGNLGLTPDEVDDLVAFLGTLTDGYAPPAPKQILSAHVPSTYKLHQNYPNPFNPVTTVDFSLPEASHVTLDVFNIMGQKVASLVDGRLEGGEHRIQWDSRVDGGGTAATGVYLYRLQANDFVETKKMLLLK